MDDYIRWQAVHVAVGCDISCSTTILKSKHSNFKPKQLGYEWSNSKALYIMLLGFNFPQKRVLTTESELLNHPRKAQQFSRLSQNLTATLDPTISLSSTLMLTLSYISYLCNFSAWFDFLEFMLLFLNSHSPSIGANVTKSLLVRKMDNWGGTLHIHQGALGPCKTQRSKLHGPNSR